MSGLVEQAKQFQSTLQLAESVIALVPKLKAAGGADVPAEVVALVEKISEHVKVLIADFAELERIAGAEFEVIKAIMPKEAAPEAAK
ncbi:MAG TPA: hypothetical protein V6D22_16835 [Candidatus Obscuribacterales bacterium]